MHLSVHIDASASADVGADTLVSLEMVEATTSIMILASLSARAMAGTTGAK